MHILTADILEMVKIMQKVTIVIKYEIIYWLSIGIIASALELFKGQGYAHFDNEYLGNGDI